MPSNDRRLCVDGLFNARDLGGLPLVGGGTTPYGVFFRSENVDAVTTAGWSQLRDAGIRTVVDLRQADERARDTCQRPGWLRTVHVDLDGLENQEFWSGYWDNGLGGTAVYYLPHLTAMPERAGAALTALAEASEGGVLFHCMGGRDRTGLIAMLVLSIARVQPEAIVDDYLETVRIGTAGTATGLRNEDEARVEALLARHGTSTEQAFRDAVAGLELEGLLARAGLTARVRHTLETWRGRLPRV